LVEERFEKLIVLNLLFVYVIFQFHHWSYDCTILWLLFLDLHLAEAVTVAVWEKLSGRQISKERWRPVQCNEFSTCFIFLWRKCLGFTNPFIIMLHGYHYISHWILFQ